MTSALRWLSADCRPSSTDFGGSVAELVLHARGRSVVNPVAFPLMPSAVDALAAMAPTEFGGANASTGFDYQRNWTLCLLIDLHGADGDYLVVCDYHDDVLVLEGGVSSDRIDFYQVKTRNKQKWTINALLKQEKGKSGNLLPSVLGKLFRHKQTFKGRARRLTVVCNLDFSIEPREDADCTQNKITFEALKDEDKAAIVAKIKAELACADSPEVGVSLVFLVSPLNLSDHENGTRGRLEELLRRTYPDRTQFPVHPIYKVLADEVARRSSCRDACHTSHELIKLKGIHRRQLEDFIVSSLRHADRVNPQRLGDELKEELRTDGVPFLRRRKVSEALTTYSLERMGGSRADLAKLGKLAVQYVSKDVAEDSRLVDILTEGAVRLRRSKHSKALSDEYLMAIVAWEVLTNGRELPAPSPQPEDEDE